MHENGVVHRDLKPANIMLCNDGSIRIMDFGIARAANARRLTFVGFTPTMGTPDYMAPEQVKGSRGDERTDIYSLGAILYEMATGEPPFAGDSPYVIMNARVTGDPQAPRKINPNLTPVLEEIILHAMERDSEAPVSNGSRNENRVGELRSGGHDEPSHPVAGAAGLEIAVPDGAHDRRLCPVAGDHLFAFAVAFPKTLMAATNMKSRNRWLGMDSFPFFLVLFFAFAMIFV